MKETVEQKLIISIDIYMNTYLDYLFSLISLFTFLVYFLAIYPIFSEEDAM